MRVGFCRLTNAVTFCSLHAAATLANGLRPRPFPCANHRLAGAAALQWGHAPGGVAALAPARKSRWLSNDSSFLDGLASRSLHRFAFLQGQSQGELYHLTGSRPSPKAGLPSPLATPRVRACCEVARRHSVRHREAFEARHRPAAGSDHRSERTSLQWSAYFFTIRLARHSGSVV